VNADYFYELNAYVYQSSYVAVLDGVIWCLGPYVDDTRPYGPSRITLAWLTRKLIRGWLRLAN
jgi:hypothetical protein